MLTFIIYKVEDVALAMRILLKDNGWTRLHLLTHNMQHKASNFWLWLLYHTCANYKRKANENEVWSMLDVEQKWFISMLGQKGIPQPFKKELYSNIWYFTFWFLNTTLTTNRRYWCPSYGWNRHMCNYASHVSLSRFSPLLRTQKQSHGLRGRQFSKERDDVFTFIRDKADK